MADSKVELDGTDGTGVDVNSGNTSGAAVPPPAQPKRKEKGTAAAAPGSSDFAGVEAKSEHDRKTEIVLETLAKRIDAMHSSVAVIEHTGKGSVTAIGALEKGLLSLQTEIATLRQSLTRLGTGVEGAFDRIQQIEQQLADVARQAGAGSVSLKAQIQEQRARLLQADAELRELNAQPRQSAQELQQQLDVNKQAAQGRIDAAAREIIALNFQLDKDTFNSKLVESRLEHLQKQFRDTLRKLKEAEPAQGRPWSTDSKGRVYKSAERLFNNSAFSKPETRSTDDLRVNEEIQRLFTHALFALQNFSEFVAVPMPLPGTPAAPATPGKKGASLASSAGTPLRNANADAQQNEQNIVNAAVIGVIRYDLSELQYRTDGLIGSHDKNLQFWGKVLLTIATAILLTLAAVQLATVFGFTAYFASFATALQANYVISTVLTFVAEKLALDMATAATVVAVATAGSFGLFGAALHQKGAPTSLKRDIDNAAQAFEADLAKTPAARMGV